MPVGLMVLLMHFQPGTGRPTGGTETSLGLSPDVSHGPANSGSQRGASERCWLQGVVS